MSYQRAGSLHQNERDTHVNTNEAYLDLFVNQWAYFKAGKKRESWSVGNIFYPVDIINPPRNPLDPSKSREGVYLTAIELPFGTSSLGLTYFPRVEFGPDDKHGIPGRIDFDDGGLGVRSYFFIRETDISFVYYRAERTPSLMKDYYGLTVNRFFGYLGAYIEVLGHEGRDREVVRTDSIGVHYFPDDDERAELGRSDRDVYVDFSVGADYTFSDNTRIGLEYLHSAEGYDDDEFGRLQDFFAYAELVPPWYAGDPGARRQKGTEVLQDRIRRNYLGVSFDRPHTRDDFFPRLNAVVSLDDGSFAMNGLLEYRFEEDTSLKLVLTRLVGDSHTEFGLRPGRGRVTLEIKHYW
jgi:hypothetical protein